MSAKIESWVPPAARGAIEQWRRVELSPSSRAVLDRLSTWDVMNTDVWRKLPPELAGVEGEIIRWCLTGHWHCTQPPMPSSAARLALWKTWGRARHARARKGEEPKTPFVAASAAECLSLEMDALDDASRAAWALHWRGDPISYDQLRDLVRECAKFYKQLENEWWSAARGFPGIRKKHAKDAPQIKFSKYLSHKFIETYGQRLNEIVGVLTDVVFAQAGKTGADTVRGRLRQPKRRNIPAKN